MKFVKFDHANFFLQTKQIVDGKPADVTIPYYSEKGFIVLVSELTEEDIKILKDTRRLYVVVGPDAVSPPIMCLQALNPFIPAPEQKPKSKLVDLNGKALDNGKEN